MECATAGTTARSPRRPENACANILDHVFHTLPETSLLALLGRCSMRAGPEASSDSTAATVVACGGRGPTASTSTFMMAADVVDIGADEGGHASTMYADSSAPLALTAFRVTESASPHLPTSFFECGGAHTAKEERLAHIVVEGMVIDASSGVAGGAAATALWAGGNAARLRLRPVSVMLRMAFQSVSDPGHSALVTRSSATEDSIPPADAIGGGWMGWYELRTEHAVYNLRLPDRTYAEWYNASDGARLAAVVGAANAAMDTASGDAYVSYLERLLSHRVRECDLFANARFVRAHLSSLCGQMSARDGALGMVAQCKQLRTLMETLHAFEIAQQHGVKEDKSRPPTSQTGSTLEDSFGKRRLVKAVFNDWRCAMPLSQTDDASDTTLQSNAVSTIQLPMGPEYVRTSSDRATLHMEHTHPAMLSRADHATLGAPPENCGMSLHDIVPFEAGEEWEAQRLIGRRVQHASNWLTPKSLIEDTPAAVGAAQARDIQSSGPLTGEALACGGVGSHIADNLPIDGSLHAMIMHDGVAHVEYLVEWKGWSVEHATWEPLRNLGGCRALIRQFHRDAGSEALGEKEVRATIQLAGLEAYIERCGGNADLLSGWDVAWQVGVGEDGTITLGQAVPGAFISPTGQMFRSPFEIRRHLQLGTTIAAAVNANAKPQAKVPSGNKQTIPPQDIALAPPRQMDPSSIHNTVSQFTPISAPPANECASAGVISGPAAAKLVAWPDVDARQSTLPIHEVVGTPVNAEASKSRRTILETTSNDHRCSEAEAAESCALVQGAKEAMDKTVESAAVGIVPMLPPQTVPAETNAIAALKPELRTIPEAVHKYAPKRHLVSPDCVPQTEAMATSLPPDAMAVASVSADIYHTAETAADDRDAADDEIEAVVRHAPGDEIGIVATLTSEADAEDMTSTGETMRPAPMGSNQPFIGWSTPSADGRSKVSSDGDTALERTDSSEVAAKEDVEPIEGEQPLVAVATVSRVHASAAGSVARCKRHRLCSRGPSHPGSCRLPIPKGKRDGARNKHASPATPVCFSEGVVLCGVARWASTGADAATMLSTSSDADYRRRVEASTAGLDASQCERHPLCVRGFKHRGKGGHCALPAGTGGAPVVSSKRARHLRLLELNSGLEAASKPGTPLSAEDEARHLAACERRRNMGKRVTFAPTPPPRSPPSTPSWSDDEESAIAGLDGIDGTRRPPPRRFAEIDAAYIISANGPRPLRSTATTTLTPSTPAEFAATKMGIPWASSSSNASLHLATEKFSGVRSAPVARDAGPQTLRSSESTDGSGLAGASIDSTGECAGSMGGGRNVVYSCKRSEISSNAAPVAKMRNGAIDRFEPCERDPRCVRGVRHGGWGGRCSYRLDIAASTSTTVADNVIGVAEGAALASIPTSLAGPASTSSRGRLKRTRETSFGNARKAAADSAIGEAGPSPTDQCERNALCTRGYKHRGWGGHCRIVHGATSLPASARTRPCERNPHCVRGFKHCGKGGMCSFGLTAAGSPGSPTSSTSKVAAFEETDTLVSSTDDATDPASSSAMAHGKKATRDGPATAVKGPSKTVSETLGIEHRSLPEDVRGGGGTEDRDSEENMDTSEGVYHLPHTEQALVAPRACSHLESPEQDDVDLGGTATDDDDDVEDEQLSNEEATGDHIEGGTAPDADSCDGLFVPPQQMLEEYMCNAGSAVEQWDVPEMASMSPS